MYRAFTSLLLAAASTLLAQVPRIFREPAMNATRIAFVYADDIWTVPREGGEARRLTSTANVRSGPYFSPDGRIIAYGAHAGGNDNTYVMPATTSLGGRLTARASRW